MASTPQPAVEGGSPETAGPAPGPGRGSEPAASGRTPDGRRSGESGIGAHSARGPQPSVQPSLQPPQGRSGSSSSPAPSQAPTQRQPVLPATPGGAPQLPVGRAAPPRDGRVSRPRPSRGPRVVQGRRTRRVVRKIDVWTVLKMSLLFYLCVLLVMLIAGIVLWNIADAFNIIHSVEKFIRSIFDLAKFTFHPAVVLQSAALGGLILVVMATGANVLIALLYNLISDVVGGVQFIVLEETTPSE